MTAGPTYEPIDAVRFIGNRSSGVMGVSIARAFAEAGNRVTLLAGPGVVCDIDHNSRTTTDTTFTARRFRTTADLQTLLRREFPRCDVLVMAAAVADYRPVTSRRQLTRKLGRGNGLTLKLEPTPDLLAGLASKKRVRRPQVVVGFALEERANLVRRADEKLHRKGLDLIVANPLSTMDAATIEAVVLGRGGTVYDTNGPSTKPRFARVLRTLIEQSVRQNRRVAR